MGRNKYYKNKKGIKISTIVDINGIPLSLLIINGNESDLTSLKPTVDNLFIETNSYQYKNNNRYKQYFLGDKGYYSKNNKLILSEKGYKPIIGINNRNTKNPKKIKRLSPKEKIIYKKRIIVENFFAKIKKYPKLDKIYEKKIDNYFGLLLLGSLHLLNNFMTK